MVKIFDNYNKKILLAAIFLGSFLIINPNSYAQEIQISKTEQNYEQLVQKNLQLRTQMKEMEDKFSALETERQLLILHSKRLQEERDALIDNLKNSSAQDENSKISQLEKIVDELNRKIIIISQEKDSIEHDMSSLKSLTDNKDLKIWQEERERFANIEKENNEIKTKNETLLKKLKSINKKPDLQQNNALSKEELLELQKLRKKVSELSRLVDQKEKVIQSKGRSVFSEKEKFKAEIRKVLDKIKISDEQLDNLKKRVKEAEVREKEAQIKLASQNEIRIKLEDEIKKLKNEKAFVIEKEPKEVEREIAMEKALNKQKVDKYKSMVDKQKLDMHYNMAVVYQKTGKYKEAENEYLKCLDISKDDPDVNYNLAILYDDKLHENEKAIYFYKKYLEIHPAGIDSADIEKWILNAEQEARLGIEVR